LASARDDDHRGTLGTIRNASLLLRLLSTGPAYQPLTDLAERSGMSLPTVHRLLRSLALAGMVEQNPDSSRYGLGPELVRLSEQYLARLPVLRSLALYLVELRNTTKATILVALLVGNEVVYVDRVDGEDVAGVFRVSHSVHPALDTAAGRVLLAHTPKEQWEAAIADAAVDGTDEMDQRRWQDEPYQLLSADPLHDEVEVAVPVFDQRGRALAALSASGSASAFPEDTLVSRVVPQLQRVARAAMRTLSDA
jgi:IclR family acetate operon transcriptional repressor